LYGLEFITEETRKAMKAVLKDIQDGVFCFKMDN